MSKLITKIKKNKFKWILSLCVLAVVVCATFFLIGTQANTSDGSKIYSNDVSYVDGSQIVDLEDGAENHHQSEEKDVDEEIVVDGINYFDISLNTSFGMSGDFPMASHLDIMHDLADYVVIGRFGEFEEAVNTARNWRNHLEEDPNNYHLGRIYSFHVHEVLKGQTYSDTISIVLQYLRRFSGEIRNDIIDAQGQIVRPATEIDPWEIYARSGLYMEPIPEDTVMLFLSYSSLDEQFFPALEPYVIVLEDDGTMRVRSNLFLPREEREKLAVTHGTSQSGRPITFTWRTVLTEGIRDTISGKDTVEIIDELESFDTGEPHTHAITLRSFELGASLSHMSAIVNQTITINAGIASAGRVFAGWTSPQNIVFADANAVETTFTMIDRPVAVIANWRDEYLPTAHPITLTNGGVGASVTPEAAVAGQTVTISAGTAPDGQVFNGWTSAQGVTFASANLSVTTFIMPDEPVSVTAHWRAEFVPPTVTIIYDELTIHPGRELQFFEHVTPGVGEFFDTFVWEVEGYTSSYTSIDHTGLLFAGSDEMSETLVVRRRLLGNSSVYDMVIVEVLLTICYNCGEELDPDMGFCPVCVGVR